MKISVREGIKTLILAPAVAGISYLVTNIMYADAVTAGALPAGQPYAMLVGAFVFGVIVVLGMDKVILDEA